MRKFTDIVIDREGNAVVGAEVYVRDQDDDSLVQLYSDDGATTTANPVTTNSDGMFSFWTANNTLKIQVWVDGVQENEITNVQHFDIDGITAFGFSLIDDANAAAALTTLGVSAFAQTILDDADAATARATLGVPISTAAEYRNDTAGKVLTGEIVWDAAEPVALSESAGSVALDLSTGINFTLAMAGNYTLANPTNEKPGQNGFIQITQDATGSRTLAYGSEWKFPSGSDPVLSTTANAVDVLFYQVLSSGVVFGNLVKALS